MELQRATLLMYASCAWFFDDVAGLEASLGVRLAAYAIDLMGQAGGDPPIEGFLERLGEAKSNVREEGTGADVFRRVTGDRFTARHAVAFAGAAGLIGPAWVAPAPSGYAVDIRDERGGPGPAGMTLSGHALATSRRTGLAEELELSALERAGSGLEIEVRVGGETLTLADLGRDHRERLVWGAIRKRLASGAPSELALLRLAVETAKEAQGTAAAAGSESGEGAEDARERQQVLVQLLERLLERELGTLSRDEVAVAAQLLDAAHLSPNDRLRRRLEEMVWDQLDAGADPRTVAPLTERLGFSEEAIGGEVIAS
jgi:hypothetical protein